jgi:putative membrane protein
VPSGAGGEAVPVLDLGGAWQPTPAVVVPAAAALVLFVQALLRLRRRGRVDHAPWSRLVLFAAGLAVLTLPLLSPLDAIADHDLLSAHMLQHVLIGDAAPALFLVALRGPLLVFFLPTAALAPMARLRPVRAVLALMLTPRVSFAAWALAFGAWHVPAAYDAALAHPVLHDVEHLSFVLVGLLVWSQLVDPARRGRLSVPERLAFAFGLLLLGTLLSDVLLFAPRPLYPPYLHPSRHLLGLSALADQRLAGLVMTVEQLVTLGTFAVVLRTVQRPGFARRAEIHS